MTTAIDQAIAALEPLAKRSKSVSESHAEDRDVSITVTVGDLRAAVRALAALRAEQPQLETCCICDLTGELEFCPEGQFCEIHQGGEFQAPRIVVRILAGYKEKLLYFAREYQDEAGRTQAIAAAVAAERERIREGLSIRLNDYLCEMKPDYDDSITGFNEAWDIVRKCFRTRAEPKTGRGE